MENYLLFESTCTKRRTLAKLRLSCHNLFIETGRHCFPKIPAENRICKRCDSGRVEDEKHFFLDCKFYVNERKILFQNLASFSTFHGLSLDEQFIYLISYGNGDRDIYNVVANYVHSAYGRRN